MAYLAIIHSDFFNWYLPKNHKYGKKYQREVRPSRKFQLVKNILTLIYCTLVLSLIYYVG